MVRRIVIFEHWGQLTGRDTGEREDRAFWGRLIARHLSLSLSNTMALTTPYGYGIFAIGRDIRRGAL